ncbi:P-loop NTPase fold protein [Promicromonospora soli]
MVDVRGFLGHPGPVNTVAVMRDGRFASGGKDGTVRVWDPGTREQLGILVGHTGPVNDVAALRDGRIVTGGEDGTLRVWDLTSGTHDCLTGHTGPVNTLTVLPDGPIVSGGTDGKLRVWDLTTGTDYHLSGHAEGWVQALAAPPNGSIISSGDDGTLRVWTPGFHERAQIAKVVPGGLITAMVVAKDGRVIIGGQNGTVQTWDRELRKRLRTRTCHIGPVTALASLPDGRIVSGGRDGAVRVWGREQHEQLGTRTDHTGAVNALAVLPDGRIVSGSDDGSLRMWNLTSGTQHNLVGHTSPLNAVKWLPDGRIVTGGADGTLRVWGRKRHERLEVLARDSGPVFAMEVLPDGRILSGREDGTVWSWAPGTHDHAQILTTRDGAVRALATLHDGRTISSGDDTVLQIWDPKARTKHALRTDGGPDDWLSAISTLSGQRIVAGDLSGKLWVWDLSAGTHHVLLGHAGRVNALAVLPDWRIVSAGSDAVVRVWDPETRVQLASLTGHIGPVNAVAALPDGRIVSGGSDGSVRVWDLTREIEQWVLEAHWGPVTGIAVGPDESGGSVVMTVSVDGTMRWWDPDTGVQTDGTFDPGVVVDQHAAVLSDEPAMHDNLQFTSHVSAMARLVTAVTTVPPLAIALLAPWGGGKSSFMRQLAATVTSLSGSGPQYVRAARVVEFNAWHYSDTSVLVGLVTQVFRQLRNPPQTAGSPTSRVAGNREAKSETPSLLSDRILDAEKKLARRQRDAERVGAAETSDATASSSTQRLIGTVTRHLHALAQLPAAAWSQGSPVTVLSTGMFLLLALVVPVVLPLVAPDLAAQLTVVGTWLAGSTAPLIAAITTVWVGLRTQAHRLAAQGAMVNRLLNPVEGFVRNAAHQRLVRAEEELAALKARDALSALIDLLDDNSRQEQLEAYRGVVGHIEDALAQLAACLRSAATYVQGLNVAEHSEVSGANLFVDRVILHIDDLDRCPPERVVEVMQAVALLQSSELFVVLVSVDPRWLRKSLEHHESTSFAGPTVHDRIRLTVGEPLSYLDKVFQIPFALPSLTDDVAADYLLKTVVERGLTPSSSLTRNRPDGRQPRGDRDTSEMTPGTSPTPRGPDLRSFSVDPVHQMSDRNNDPGDNYMTSATFTPIVRSRQARSLALTWYETHYLAKLATVLSTPRAVKKLLNLYQLLRLGTHMPEHARFTDEGGEHLAAGLLLALVVGAPVEAAQLFQTLDTAHDETLLRDAVTAAAGRHGDSRHPNCRKCTSWERVRNTVDAALEAEGLPAHAPATAALYVPWVQEVSRFSFHTEYMWNR